MVTDRQHWVALPDAMLSVPNGPTTPRTAPQRKALNRIHSLEIPDDMELPLTPEMEMDAELDAALRLLDESFSTEGQSTDQLQSKPAELARAVSSPSASEEDDLFMDKESINSTGSKAKSKRRQRVTTKQQIDKLQGTVEELTTKLQSLESGMYNTQQASSTADGLSERGLLWQQIAARQRERRQQAEMDNAILREMLNLQVEEAKNLKRILKRRTRIEMMENMLGVKRLKTLVTSDLEDTVCALDAMLRQTHELYATTDQVFAEKSVGAIACPGTNRTTNRHATNGVFLEISKKQLVPFPAKMIEGAVWTALGQFGMQGLQCVKDFNGQVDFHAQHSQKTHDTMVISYVALTSGFQPPRNIHIRKVVQKFVEVNRVVFICRMCTNPELSDGSSGIALACTLRIVVEKLESSDEGVVTSFCSVSRHLPNPQVQGNVDQAIAVWDETVSRMHGEIESVLLDSSISGHLLFQ